MLPRLKFIFFNVTLSTVFFMGVASAAWVDAPAEPPYYGINPGTTQDDYKPLNLGSTFQSKTGGASFATDSNAQVGVGTSTPATGARMTVYENNPNDTALYARANSAGMAAAVYAEQLGGGYVIYASGGLNYFSGNVGIGTTAPNARLAVGGAGSVGDTIAAYANSANSAIYAEQQGGGYAIYASGKITTNNQICFGSDCKSSWNEAAPSNYVSGLQAGAGIFVSGSASPGWSPTVAVNTAAILSCTGSTQKIIWDAANSRFTCADEVDNTVLASVKDGVSWSELSGIPGGCPSGQYLYSFSGACGTPSFNGVTSLNSRVGAIDLQSGPGISITSPSPSVISIASTFSESDTLQTVTNRGNSTTNAISIQPTLSSAPALSVVNNSLSGTGIYAKATGHGVYGKDLSNSGVGVGGDSSNVGVYGYSSSNIGVYAFSQGSSGFGIDSSGAVGGKFSTILSNGGYNLQLPAGNTSDTHGFYLYSVYVVPSPSYLAPSPQSFNPCGANTNSQMLVAQNRNLNPSVEVGSPVNDSLYYYSGNILCAQWY